MKGLILETKIFETKTKTKENKTVKATQEIQPELFNISKTIEMHFSVNNPLLQKMTHPYSDSTVH